MKLKKMITGVIAAAMVLSMSTVAFADNATYKDVDSVTVTKSYKLVGNGSSPDETFTLEQVGNGKVTDGDAASAPALGAITGAHFSVGAATTDGVKEQITINLPTYDTVGVYEYTLKEVAGTTAGVNYYANPIKLVVTVVQDGEKKRVAAVHVEESGEKTDVFENTYSAGVLKVTKTVTGNLGDKEKYFKFVVTLTGEDAKTYPAGGFAVAGGSYASNPAKIQVGEATTFWLKDNETLSIENIPYGVTYTVTEDDYSADDYITTKNGDSGTINAAEQTAAFTNAKDIGEVDTGINLDSLPYIMILAVVAIALVAFFGKKRMARNN